jgi:hypothetical protein
VRRDSLFGEPVVWSGQPKVVSVPATYRVGAAVCGVAAVVATASAVVVATALHAPVGQLVAFAAWMTTLCFALAYGPRWWRARLVYEVTERHIVVRRGKLRRTIDRDAVSFARIHWHPRLAGIGDLELVRAVPTGALRRRLSIVLTGLVAPDRVWAIIRGVPPVAAAGDGHRLLAQRLDDGERVLWSAQPPSRWRAWLPASSRARASLGLGVVMSVLAVGTSLRSLRGLRSVLLAGLAPGSVSFVALVASVGLSLLVLAGAAAAVVYLAVVRPARLEARTRYLITDRRVLIQRGDEELHLDRARIVDVIDTDADGGLRDVFLVLDGPRAAAVASNGAFGEEPGQGLVPVLHRVADAEVVRRILRGEDPSAEAFPDAA